MIGIPPSPPSFICHPVTSAFVREAILVIESRKRVYCESVLTGENYSSCAKLEFVKDYSFIKILQRSNRKRGLYFGVTVETVSQGNRKPIADLRSTWASMS